jgi:hypothetical protein
MKKLIAALILFSSLHVGLQAQDLTAEQIVAKYANICADKGYLDTIRSTKVVVKIIVEEDTMTGSILKISGRSFYQKVTGEAGESVRIYNNGRGVEIIGTNKQNITDKGELDEMKLQSYILPDMEYKKLGYKMTLEGESKLEGVEYHVVKLVSPNGYTKTNYYEKATGLLRLKIDQSGMKTELKEYVKIKGGLYPKVNKLIFQDGLTLTIILTEMSNNVAIDPAIFEF